MAKLPNQDPRHHMFTSTDRSADIKCVAFELLLFLKTDISVYFSRRWEDIKTEAEECLPVLMATQSTLRRQLTDTDRQCKAVKVCSMQTYFSILYKQLPQDRERMLRAEVDKMLPEIVRLQQEAIIEAPVNIDFLEVSKAVGNSYPQIVSYLNALLSETYRRKAVDH